MGKEGAEVKKRRQNGEQRENQERETSYLNSNKVLNVLSRCRVSRITTQPCEASHLNVVSRFLWKLRVRLAVGRRLLPPWEFFVHDLSSIKNVQVSGIGVEFSPLGQVSNGDFNRVESVENIQLAKRVSLVVERREEIRSKEKEKGRVGGRFMRKQTFVRFKES